MEKQNHLSGGFLGDVGTFAEKQGISNTVLLIWVWNDAEIMNNNDGTLFKTNK